MIVSALLFLSLLLPPLPDPALVQAQASLEAGHFDEAATEYKRFIFFHRDSTDARIGDSYYQLGLSLRNCGRFQESLEAFQKSLEWEGGRWNPEDKRISVAASLTALGRYSEAEFSLLRLEDSAASADVRKRASLLRAINALYGRRWEEAREALQSFVDVPPLPGEDGTIHEAAQRFLAGKKSIHTKSRKLAKTLSTVLPGSGQFYAHDWKGGANALALNGIFGYLFFRDIATQHYVLAAVSSVFVFKRFYIGNRRNAARAADAYNDTVNKILALALLDAIEKQHEN
jgi:tetratricopeptide (TPR) repeat protein